MKRSFDRLNHILIPTTKAERDRFRNSRMGRFFRLFEGLYYRSTLEGQVFGGAVMAAGISGLDVMGSDEYLLFLLLFFLYVSSNIASQFFRLKDVRLDVQCPARVTMGEELHFSITLHNDSTHEIPQARVIGPFLPWDGRWRGLQPHPVALPAKSVARTEARARFLQRGQHHLDPFRAGRVAPLGLALGPTILGPGCRFVVVPKVATVLSLRMPQPRSVRSGGVPLHGRAGDSMDLLGIRPYRPGDRARDLHARSWARSGNPVVREYMQEAITAVGIILDPSGEDDELFDARLSLTAGILAFLLRNNTVPEVLDGSPNGRELVVGARFAGIEQALELLACMETSTPQAADALAARVARRENPWSRALLVCGSIGPWQQAVADGLARMGIPCGIYVVANPEKQPESEDRHTRVLSYERVLSGEGLWL